MKKKDNILIHIRLQIPYIPKRQRRKYKVIWMYSGNWLSPHVSIWSLQLRHFLYTEERVNSAGNVTTSIIRPLRSLEIINYFQIAKQKETKQEQQKSTHTRRNKNTILPLHSLSALLSALFFWLRLLVCALFCHETIMDDDRKPYLHIIYR